MVRSVFAFALLFAAAPCVDAQQNTPRRWQPRIVRGFPSATIPGPLTVPQQMPAKKLGATPVGTAPGPDYSWRSLPGVGYGWVQDSVAGGDPPVVGGPLARLTRKAVCERLRTLAVERAVAKGIPRAEARKKIAKISDEQILGGAIAMGAPVGALGDGTILRWLWEHRDEIIRWILSILSLFGDEPVEVGQLHDADTYYAAAPVPNHLIPPVVDPIRPGYRWCFQRYELVVLQVEGEIVTYRCTSCPEMSWPGVGPGCERNQQTRQRVREEVAAFGVPVEPWDGRLWFDL